MIQNGQRSLQNQVFFYLIFAVSAALALWLISSYLGIIAFSLIMVIILRPVYKFILRPKFVRPWLATALTILFFFAVLIVPAWFIISAGVDTINTLADNLESGTELISLEDVQERVNSRLSELAPQANIQMSDEQVERLRTASQSALKWLAEMAVSLGMSIPALIARTFIFLGIVGSLLPNYAAFTRRLLRLSPLEDEVDRLYLRKLKATVWSMFVGIFIIAVLQGLLMGGLYWVGKVPYLPLWTLLSLVAAMLPLGASLVAIPVGILQLVAGNYTSAVIVLGGYLLLVSNIDNLVRPKLVSKEAYMNFALLMLSALGGYELFGFFGVIYGPVLMILFLTTMDVYLAHYAESNSSEKGSEPQSALPAQQISDTVKAAPPLPLDDGTVGTTASASD